MGWGLIGLEIDKVAHSDTTLLSMVIRDGCWGKA